MDEEWWVRRAVIALLVVVGLATTVYAVMGIREDSTTDEADSSAVDPALPLDDVPAEAEGPLRTGEVIVVGRHGAPAERPAHTEAAYRLAAEQGAAYLEVEVVATEDGELLVSGDNELSDTTDVADRPEFADRETTKTVDGASLTGWFSEDFTLDELRTLAAVEPDPDLRPGNVAFDGTDPLLGFEDVLDLVEDLSDEQDRTIGLFVQPRRSAYFREIGLGIERDIARAIERSGLTRDPERVVVESNDPNVLERLDERLGDSVLSAIVIGEGDQDRLTQEAIADLADYVDAVAVQVEAFAGEDPFELVQRVHDADLAMIVFPISYENQLLAPGFRSGDDPAARGNLVGQVKGLVTIGVDVILAEAPGDVIEALAQVAETGTEESSETD